MNTGYKRWLSRCFWIVIIAWAVTFVAVMKNTEAAAALSVAAGAVSTAFVGLEKLADRDERRNKLMNGI